jgi:hypothetical protein
MVRFCLYFGFILLLFNACVPNRQIVYLQKDDLSRRERIPKDTVLRTHPLEIREYRIQPLDILSVSFETLSDESDDFDFYLNFLPKATE